LQLHASSDVTLEGIGPRKLTFHCRQQATLPGPASVFKDDFVARIASFGSRFWRDHRKPNIVAMILCRNVPVMNL
jgi:hypothetical protein